MVLGTIAQIWRYPVKSMAGEHRDSVIISQHGIPGDRGWALFDETRQGISGGKRLPALRCCRARYPSEPVAGAASPAAEVTLPDGSTFMCDQADASRRMTGFLGRPVSFHGLGGAGSETAPRITMQSETEETVRALNGLVAEEPMPDYSAFPPERLKELRRGNFFDAYPVHLLTRTSLRSLAKRAPDRAWDERRFRPNALLDVTDGGDFPELGWLGRRLQVGSAVLEVVVGCPRCVMVTQPVDELPHDPGVMRTLVREAHHIAGVYAGVAVPGEARVGDRVELV
jgi:uncharacterized protein YcbX